ncbi:hypothetical protein A5N71_19150 [Prescottella equi]|nr:hypothetical protein A5N71_19150 [Prescottella equi]
MMRWQRLLLVSERPLGLSTTRMDDPELQSGRTTVSQHIRQSLTYTFTWRAHYLPVELIGGRLMNFH